MIRGRRRALLIALAFECVLQRANRQRVCSGRAGAGCAAEPRRRRGAPHPARGLVRRRRRSDRTDLPDADASRAAQCAAQAARPAGLPTAERCRRAYQKIDLQRLGRLRHVVRQALCASTKKEF